MSSEHIDHMNEEPEYVSGFKYCNFVFTQHDPEQLELYKSGALLEFGVKYLVVGDEVGKETQKRHLQGYCELEKGRGIKYLRNLFGGKIWIRERKGTQQQAADYCKKEGKFFEIGKPKAQGRRNDIREVKLAAIKGGMKEVVRLKEEGEQEFNLQAIKVAEIYLKYNGPQRKLADGMKIIWLWGESGTGKTTRAWDMMDALGIEYYSNDCGKWWDGYEGEKAVILDDFRDTWWEMDYMTKLLQPRPFRVRVLYGTTQMRANFFIITTIKHPKDHYVVGGMGNEPIKQLVRRIDSIIECKIDEKEKVEEEKVGGNIETPT